MAMDPNATLAHIEDRLGSSPRDTSKRLLNEFRGERPYWASGDDLIRLPYDHLEEIVSRGRPTWAAVIHANETVFTPDSARAVPKLSTTPPALAP